MQKTIFNITKMDCPSEEQLIRMKLQKFDEIKSLEFDISARKASITIWIFCSELKILRVFLRMSLMKFSAVFFFGVFMIIQI